MARERREPRTVLEYLIQQSDRTYEELADEFSRMDPRVVISARGTPGGWHAANATWPHRPPPPGGHYRPCSASPSTNYSALGLPTS